MSAIVNALDNKPFDYFLRFCEALIETNQMHVIRDYLTPEGLSPRIVQAEPDELPDASQEINVRDEQTQQRNQETKIKLQKEMRKIADFDWKNAIRVSLPKLADEIEPDGDLMNKLVSAGIISETNLDVFMVGSIHLTHEEFHFAFIIQRNRYIRK